MPWARPSIASPSAVKATEWVSRTKRRRDAACSRRRTCWLTVDCRSPRRRPASVKLRAFATVTKVVSRVGSNMARSSRNVMTITPVIGLHNVLPHRHLEQLHQAALRSRSMRTLSRFRPDEFSIAMLATVTLSLLLPSRGPSARVFELLTAIAIALLFFLQGARLSRAAIVAGALHWRLHLVVFAATFVLFPVVGLALRPLSATLLTPPLYLGLLFLSTCLRRYRTPSPSPRSPPRMS